MVAKFVANASGAIWWPCKHCTTVLHPSTVVPNLEPMQVAFFLAGEITQVKESIPWVRCASDNVYLPELVMPRGGDQPNLHLERFSSE